MIGTIDYLAFGLGVSSFEGNLAKEFRLSIFTDDLKKTAAPYIGLFSKHMGIRANRYQSSKAGMLGVKAGSTWRLIRTRYITLHFTPNIGIAKVSIQDDPWWGHPENSEKNTDAYEIELVIKIVGIKGFIDIGYFKSSFTEFGQGPTLRAGYLF